MSVESNCGRWLCRMDLGARAPDNLDCLCRAFWGEMSNLSANHRRALSSATLHEHGNLSLSTRHESLGGREDDELLNESCSETLEPKTTGIW